MSTAHSVYKVHVSMEVDYSLLKKAQIKKKTVHDKPEEMHYKSSWAS